LSAAAALRGAKVLTISEANLLFERQIGILRQKDPDYQPTQMLAKAVEYTQRFATTKSQAMAMQSRECVALGCGITGVVAILPTPTLAGSTIDQHACRLMASYNLNEWELGLVANLSPADVEEAKKLVPSIAAEVGGKSGPTVEIRKYEALNFGVPPTMMHINDG
jgi:hypothetical protein